MFQKNPCDPRTARSILFLNCSKLVGKESGKNKEREHVDTVGKGSLSVKTMLGETFPKPKGGTELQPVKKTITSFRFGELSSAWAIIKIKINK